MLKASKKRHTEDVLVHDIFVSLETTEEVLGKE